VAGGHGLTQFAVAMTR